MKFENLIDMCPCHKFYHKKFEVYSSKNVGVIMQKLFFQCLHILCASNSAYKAQKCTLLKGAGPPGGGMGVDDPGKVKIEFYVVPDRGECQIPDAFYQIKKYCS